MSYTPLLQHAVSIKRPTATTGVKKTYQAIGGSSDCLILPLDDVATQQAGMAFGKGYRCTLDYTVDVREGDQLVDQLGRVFFVRGMKKHNYGSFPHLQLLIEEDKRP